MKLLLLLMGICLLTVITLGEIPPQTTLAGAEDTSSMKYVSSFEGGDRYLAGAYAVIVLNGSFREMGRQYGSLMKPELQEEYQFIVSNLSERGYSAEEVREMGKDVSKFQPERLKEISKGMAETSGLTVDEINVLYDGGVIYLMVPRASPACSFLAAWGNYTTDGSVILSRNWDLPDAINKFNDWNVLAVYKPSDGSNGVATFGPAGMRPETLMNSKGLFIADDNGAESGGTLLMDNRPDLISEFFRFMLDYSDQAGLDAGIQSTLPNIAWIVDTADQKEAFSYEETIYEIKQRTGNGVIAAANHFVDPSWNFAGEPAEHSLSRYDNLLSQAEKAKGSIDAEKMMEIRDVLWEEGGATFCHSSLMGMPYSSNHQVVFAPQTRTVWIKVVDNDWQKVELASLFDQ